MRWGASSSADVRTIQAPFRSGIDIEDYQLDPVVRAIQMPRVNLLVADDVGLGKTIEAGMVALELIIRHRTRKILIVCPASLQLQWQEQMRDKFGLDFRIVNSTLMGVLRRSRGIHVNPWNHFPRLITSDRLPEARATPAAVPGTATRAGRASIPSQVRPVNRGRGPQLCPFGSWAATLRTRCGPTPSGCSCRTSNTSCFSPLRRTTAIRAILLELKSAIDTELNEPEYQQLTLFDDLEKDQFDATRTFCGTGRRQSLPRSSGRRRRSSHVTPSAAADVPRGGDLPGAREDEKRLTE